MNWLIIAPSVQDKKLKLVEDFLELKHRATPYEVFINNQVTKEELFDDIRHVNQATHCIIIDSAYMSKNPDYICILGVLYGKNIQTYIYTGNTYQKRYEELDSGIHSIFKIYSNLEEMISVLDHDYMSHVAIDNQKQALIQLFTRGIPFTSDCFAQYLAKDDTSTCQIFYDAGMLVNARTSEGVPLLCIATRNDCLSKVRWLLENGADINAISADRGYSPVMDAVWRKNYDITKYLIDRGADLSYISSDGQPILVLAVGNGNARIVDLLLANGANPDIEDSMGMSARGYAELFKKKEIIALIAKYDKKEDG